MTDQPGRAPVPGRPEGEHERQLPVPRPATEVAPATKLVPVNVIVCVPVCAPVVSDSAPSVGEARPTVKVCTLLVPPAVVTATLRAPGSAPAAIVNAEARRR